MRSMFPRFKAAAGFLSGVLIGLAVMTPVFAASSTTAEGWEGLLTVAATALLVLAVVVKTAGAPAHNISREPSPGPRRTARL